MERTDKILKALDAGFRAADWKRYGFILAACTIWGFAAHGYCFFNATGWYDNVSSMFWGLANTYGLGRWMLGIIERVTFEVFGSNGAHPFVNGMGSVLFIAWAACMLSDLLGLKKRLPLFLACGALVATPVLTGTFSYMFTAPAYFFGTALSVLAVHIVLSREKPGILRILFSIVLVAAGTGIYQSNLPVAAAAFVLVLLVRAFSLKPGREGALFKKGLVCVVILAAGLLLYLAINTCFLSSMQIAMNDHGGMDNYGMTDLPGYLRRILLAYNYFFRPERQLYHSLISKVYKGLLLWLAVLCILRLIPAFKESRKKGFLLCFLLLVYPLATCLIYVLAESPYLLTFYPYTFVYVLFIYMLVPYLSGKSIRGIWQARLGFLLVFFMSIWFTRLCEETYYMNSVVQKRLESYYSALYTRIISAPGFKDEYPVCYIHPEKKTDLNLTVTDNFESLGARSIPLDDFAWRNFLKEWVGFDPQGVDGDTEYYYRTLPEVKEMPCYPDDGSIRVIEDAVVVKFADEE